MTPKKVCPNCQNNFLRIIQNENWYEEYCRCPLHYHQYFNQSFKSDTLKYMSFYTENFLVYAYHNFGPHKDIIHVYHLNFPRAGAQSPFLELPRFPIDFSKLNDYDKRWSNLKAFK
jgi:hypothetical protein